MKLNDTCCMKLGKSNRLKLRNILYNNPITVLANLTPNSQFETMEKHTNIYEDHEGTGDGRKWRPKCSGELMAFVVICINMGIFKSPELRTTEITVESPYYTR